MDRLGARSRAPPRGSVGDADSSRAPAPGRCGYASSASAHVQRVAIGVGVDGDACAMPSRRAVRMTRQAISPRLAIRILSNMRRSTSGTRRSASPRSARSSAAERPSAEDRRACRAGSMTPSSHSRARGVVADGPGARTARGSAALKPPPPRPTRLRPARSMPSRRTVASTLAACSPPITRDARVRPHPQEARRVGAAAHAVVAGAEAAADDHRELRHRARWRPRSPSWRRPWRCRRPRTCWPTMKPVMFCRKTSGMPRWQQSSMKCAPFSADSREQDAVVGDDADRIAVEAREAGDQRRAVERLELVEARAVDEARDHLAHVVGLRRSGGTMP